jgi:hypothetical protein
MAIINTDTKKKVSADGVTREFSFGFKIYTTSDIKVWLINKITDEVIEQSLTTHYLVDIDVIDEGGTIIFDEDYIPEDGYWVFMFSDLAYTQNTVLPTDGAFREQKVSNGMDRLCRLIQQNKEAIERSIKLPIYAEEGITMPAPSAKKFIAWNDAGDGLVNKILPDPSIEVIDNLTSTDNDKALSANQGKVLQDNKLAIADIVDNLTSTDTNKALSANQGKELKTALGTKEDSLGYTPENAANKKTSLAENSDTYYVSQKAVKTAIDANAVSLGSWVSKSNNTVYQASTDGFVCVIFNGTGNGALQHRVYTDSNNPPITERQNVWTDDGQDTNIDKTSALMPVKKGDYWKSVQGGGSSTIYWIPLGS